MTSKIRVIVKDKLFRFIARFLARVGLLSILLSYTDRWIIKRNPDNRMIFPFVKKRKHSCFQVLLYHRVNDEQDPFFGSIPVKVFEMQMEVLYRHFNVMHLKELVELMLKNDLPPNAIAITFDDGYQDNYKNAFPVLKQLNLPATIFLATGCIGSKTLLWHDYVFDAFRRTNAEYLSINGKKYPLKTLSEKCIAMNTFLLDLRTCAPKEREMRIQQKTIDLGVAKATSAIEEMLNWQEIQVMSRNNISFGAHTVTHPILTQMPLAEAVDEIVASKNTIEKKLRSPVRLFAYPNGGRNDFNEPIKHSLKDAGVLCGVTTLWGNNDIHTDLFELRRIQAWDYNPQLSALRLGWYKFSS